MNPEGHPNPLSVTNFKDCRGGFRRYPTGRDAPLKTSLRWIEGKRADDALGGDFWRIHDRLYDFTGFLDVHPGGRLWLEVTRGTDITEAFESSHFSRSPNDVMEKFYVKDAPHPRNSPYTFHPDGLYMTLKKKAANVILNKGKGPTKQMLKMVDLIALVLVIAFFLAARFQSQVLATTTGLIMATQLIAAHNFYHQKDNWRMYLFDLSLLSSYEYRISHVISHHQYTNTIYDFEISMLEPFLQFLPNPRKSFFHRYCSFLFCHLIYTFATLYEFLKRIWLVLSGQISLRPENLIVFLELWICCLYGETYTSGLWIWMVLHLSCSYFFGFFGTLAGHHHPDVYHEGDMTRQDTDWGLLQLDTVRDRLELVGNLFLSTILFGDHALHHLFPTVDQSKLHLLYPCLIQTCREFKIPFHFVPQSDLLWGMHLQLCNYTPNPSQPMTFWNKVKVKLTNCHL